jgi:hypothetical protein
MFHAKPPEPWNIFTKKGNPTRSLAMNELIKALKKKAVWKQGNHVLFLGYS